MSAKVLVVEDEPDLKFLIERRFRHKIRAGELRFIFAYNGLEALEQLKMNPDVSVVLSDIKMPQMDGLELLAELNTRYPLLRTIIISAYSDMQNIRTAMNRGAYDFLTKPIDFKDLEITLDKTIRYVQQLRDEMTERNNTEKQLLQLKKAVETMQIGVTITDLSRRITYMNPADARMHGYQAQELIGKDVEVLAPPELRQPMNLEQIRNSNGSARESLNIRKDGSTFPVWLTSEVVRNADGEPIAIVTSCEDITERKQAQDELEKHRNRFEELVDERTTELVVINEALQQEIAERKKVEEALRESEEQYRTLFENLQDVFYRIDLTGNILLVSPSIIRLLGYPEEEAIKLNLGKEVFVLPEQWDEFMRLMEKNGSIYGFEVLLKRHDSAHRWGNASAQYYTNKAGHILGIEGIIRDISEHKQAEAELIAAHYELQEKNAQLAELNASKDRFFSIISHDLRTPFTSILGITEFIATNIDTYSKQEIRDQVERLKTAAEKLYALLENLLTWSRIQRGAIKCDPAVIDLFDIAQENMVIFLPKAEHKNIALRSMVQKNTRVYADYGMVNTIMRNLISNALKFTAVGGSVTVLASTRDQYVEVAVADTGYGIPQAELTKLFRIDTTYSGVGTAGEQGTGLGLILCKELVEQHGGEIWVESEVGKGTTFRFIIPEARV